MARNQAVRLIAADGAYQRCSAQVWRDRWGHTPCANLASAMVEGKPYCGVHDPVRLAVKAAERSEQWKAKEAAHKDSFEAAVRRVARLSAVVGAPGFGHPYYNTLTNTYTGGITLSVEQTDALIAYIEAKNER